MFWISCNLHISSLNGKEINILNLTSTQTNISDGKEKAENINDRSETDITSVEGPLHMYETESNPTTLVSEISNIINEENVIIAPGQRRKPVSILHDEFCEEQAFSSRHSSKSCSVL